MESLIKNIESIVGMFLISCLTALPVWGVVYQEARKRGLESKWIICKIALVLLFLYLCVYNFEIYDLKEQIKELEKLLKINGIEY